jgi:hypothetical protein
MSSIPDTIQIPACAFVPVNSDEIIVVGDDQWKRMSCSGWFRLTDSFFWPGDPREVHPTLGQYPISVEELAHRRERYVEK